MTTQVRPKTGNRTFATATVVISTANLTDSGGSFTAADVGHVVSTASVPAGTVILSITSTTVAVMSANATASTGPQSCTLAPFVSIVRDSANRTSKSTAWGANLTNGQVINALRAANIWNNGAGSSTLATQAQKIASAQGLAFQEV